MSSDPDACVPKAVTDFVFDLYESVTTSHIAEEQSKLYGMDFPELNTKYFGGGGGGGGQGSSQGGQSSSAVIPWPSPQAIAGECNGDPLFLALYRELTHRQFHATSRPTLRDRCEGWHVYRELFEEILELESFFIVPSWCFDILHEFVYQFQGFCQVRSAVYASAKKFGLLKGDDHAAAGAGSSTTTEGAGGSGSNNAPSSTLLENLSTLQSTDAWEAEAVFGYLNKLVKLASPSQQQQEGSSSKKPVVYTYLSLFASVALSRLECLLGDYTACLQAVQGPLVDYAHVIVDGDNKTAKDVLHGVLSARLSVAYHAGVSYLMLRRYKDAIATLADMCAGFSHLVASATAALGGSGAVVAMNARQHHHRDNKQDNSAASQLQSQLMKQYDRMICLLVVLTQLTPNALLTTIGDDATRRAIRDKIAKDPSGGTSLEDFFASPKFISVHTSTASASGSVVPFHRHQTNLFLKEAQLQNPYKTLRSYLKLYKSLPLDKLATFYDKTVEEVLPLLLSYKTKMRQLETASAAAESSGAESSAAGGGGADAALAASSTTSYKTAMDIHYYVVDSMCHIDEPERQRRFETHFFRQIAHAAGIARQAAAIDVRL
jgi:translation initiation factor 3 subunit L